MQVHDRNVTSVMFPPYGTSVNSLQRWRVGRKTHTPLGALMGHRHRPVNIIRQGTKGLSSGNCVNSPAHAV